MSTDLTGGYDESFERVWATQPGNPEQRESVNAWVWDDQLAIGLPRCGVEAVADQWETHDIQINVACADGRVFSAVEPGAIHDPGGPEGATRLLGAGSLSFELVDPFVHWRMRIDGTVAMSSVDAQIGGLFPGQGERVPIQAEIDLHSAAPPWMNGALLPEAKHILDTQEEGALMGHPWRFEQLCRSSGFVRVGDEEHRIEGGGNRVRRQGIRSVAQLWGHAWQAATFPSGRGFAYITYPPRQDGKPTLNEGHVFLGDGALVPARVIDPPWLQSLEPSGQDVSFGLETDQGTFEVRGETMLSTFMVMPPEILGGLELQQAIVRYTWDGETAPGMLERSIAIAELQ
jgi:hypothetical protein